ncbi:hypothetical protein LR48_Vigan10g202700 [Vigna angularis]|uniref:Uncharacterized protein n=1 Tax=Phaseolus angularis TaxID=3914 RepID=A0A0L9VM57_PHAAN|nr:uncharacterized protein HKW66_Vig0149000 [Vigna angularis]KOM56135.1 hypothetical protein LR48_Vigan10g202700 [Vigna angularis]
MDKRIGYGDLNAYLKKDVGQHVGSTSSTLKPILHHLHPLFRSPPPAKASRKSHVQSVSSASMSSTIRGVASEATLSSSPSSRASRCIIKPKSELGNPYDSTPGDQKPSHSRDPIADIALFFLLTQAWVLCLGRDSQLGVSLENEDDAQVMMKGGL